MIQIAICDDDERDLLYLKDLILKIMSNYAVKCNVREFDSGEKLLESSLAFHLIFLDIMLGGKDGIDIGNVIFRRNRSITIIYQTSFGQYCKEATNRTHAFAFLEKPIQQEILEEQLEAFIDGNSSIDDIKMEFNNVKYIWKGNEIEELSVKLPVKNIIYFEYIKQRKEIKVFTEEREYIFTGKMRAVEEKMKPYGFETCCRGILVNLANIRKIKGYSVILNNGTTMPLSQRRVSEFKRKVNEHLHGSLK